MDKTTEIPYKDGMISVAELPKTLRESVDMFDRIREDHREAMYQQHVLSAAAAGINMKITQEIAAYFESLEPPVPEATDPPEDEGESNDA